MPPDAASSIRAPDLDRCRTLMRAGSKTFSAASLMLPRRVRVPAVVLYAFCRVADDLIDDAGANPAEAVTSLKTRLAAIYAGAPADDPVDRALAAVVRSAQIPRALLEALLEGFAWDAAGRRYATLDEVYGYAARVAGTVGAMMTVVMGPRASGVIARACDLGVAMQLTNIARDVGEDAARGRIYLPLDWLRDAGIDADSWLRHPTFDARLASVVSRLLSAADVLYARADAGVAMLPRDCRLAIRTARLLYADIGGRIASAGFDSVTRRSVVPTWRKVWLLLRALRPAKAAGIGLPPLGPTLFLVAACEEAT